ncbi:16489_t:CDS:2 [Entrophospora sp. SA101]|nr:16489_t:CDS:2 [Entrophospora sp. SA101]
MKKQKKLTIKKNINHFYPQAKRKEINYLDIAGQNLEGALNLQDFTNLKGLEELNLSNNLELKALNCFDNKKLSSLDLSKNNNLVKLICYDCNINNLNLNNGVELTRLRVNNNQLTNLDFLRSVKAEKLIYLDVEFKKFKSFRYRDTEIDGGLEQFRKPDEKESQEVKDLLQQEVAMKSAKINKVFGSFPQFRLENREIKKMKGHNRPHR